MIAPIFQSCRYCRLITTSSLLSVVLTTALFFFRFIPFVNFFSVPTWEAHSRTSHLRETIRRVSSRKESGFDVDLGVRNWFSFAYPFVIFIMLWVTHLGSECHGD
ncbi:hypothetical protein FN846DRAFT_969044 [Sphaerosporella brunnea]|uniref:Uncharacterized protein n=1 Tax=Sphaerosporella brunnea TaxID=1250544 RepID=A0A5J5EK35_9PEZI|nr:hypothetical protein FN846DRAFT_969044 [Sphaerosporella brunnea]